MLQNDPQRCCKTSLMVSTLEIVYSQSGKKVLRMQTYANLLANLLVDHNVH